jgi:hypothetical protein
LGADAASAAAQLLLSDPAALLTKNRFAPERSGRSAKPLTSTPLPIAVSYVTAVIEVGVGVGVGVGVVEPPEPPPVNLILRPISEAASVPLELLQALNKLREATIINGANLRVFTTFIESLSPPAATLLRAASGGINALKELSFLPDGRELMIIFLPPDRLQRGAPTLDLNHGEFSTPPNVELESTRP